MQSTNDNSTKAFATQYTSLILILLTFVLGAFSAPSSSGASSQLTPDSPLSAFGSLHYTNLFEHQGLDSLEPLLLVLRSHDVRVRLTLQADNLGSGLEQLKLLRDYLLSEGIPDEAYKLEVKEGGKKGVDVQFLTEET